MKIAEVVTSFVVGCALGAALSALAGGYRVFAPCTQLLTTCGTRAICFDRCQHRVIWCAPDAAAAVAPFGSSNETTVPRPY